MGRAAGFPDAAPMPHSLSPRRRLRRLVASIVLMSTAVLAVPALAAADCPNADATPTAQNVPVARSATLCLLNVERTSRGLRGLRAHRQLQLAAQSYAGAMVAGGFF